MAVKKTILEKVMNILFGVGGWEVGCEDYYMMKEEILIRKKSWTWWRSNAKRVYRELEALL